MAKVQRIDFFRPVLYTVRSIVRYTENCTVYYILYRRRPYYLVRLSLYLGIRTSFCPAVSRLPETQLRNHNTTTSSVLHLITFWVVRTDWLGVFVADQFRHRDWRKSAVGIRIRRSYLFRQRLGDETSPLTPANLIVLLAPVYVQIRILDFKSVERVQIGALLQFESCIDQIVLKFRLWSKFTASGARQPDFSP